MGSPPNPGSPTSPLQEGLLGMYGMAAKIGDLLKGMNDTVDAMNKKLGDTGKGPAQGLDAAAKKAADFHKEVSRLRSDYLYLATQSEAIEDHLKGFLDIQRQLTRVNFKASSYQEAAESLTLMEEQTRKLINSQVLSGKTLEQVLRQHQAISKQIEKNNNDQTENKTFDAGEMESFSRELGKSYLLMTKLAASAKEIKFSAWSKDLHAAEKSISSLLGKASRMDKFRKHGETAASIRAARNKRREQIDGPAPTFSDALNQARETYNGAAPLADKNKTTKPAFRAAGVGPVGRRVLQQHLSGSNSVFNRAGMSLLHEGEGSIPRGLAARFDRSSMGRAASGLGVAVEGGATSVMSTIAAAAPILAILDVIKEVFDGRMQANKKVSEGLGQGGLFGGGKILESNSPLDTMGDLNTTLNTTPSRGFRLGVGYEKNMAIAKAMVDNGMGVSNLADPLHPSSDENGMERGSFGTFQRNAYAYGKLAGLSPEASTAETIKLMGQYKQSLAGTEKFFVTVARDVQAAGLTTSKYISIMDDVNSHFDRTNKILGTTVDVMKLLSRTGRMTSEDLKDMMDVATNGGKKQPLQISAYLNNRSMQDGSMGRRLQGQQGAYDDSLNTLAEAMGPNYSVSSLKEGATKDKIGYFSYLKNIADNQFAGNPAQHQAAISAIDGARSQYDHLDTLSFNMKNHDGLGQAVADENQGDNLMTQMFKTQQGMDESLRGSSFTSADYFGDKRNEMMRDPKFLSYRLAMGEDGKKYDQFIEATANAKMHIFQDGPQTTDTEQDKTERVRMAGEAKDFLKGKAGFEGFDLNNKDVVEEMRKFSSGGPDNEKLLLKYLPQMKSTFYDAQQAGRLIRTQPNMQDAVQRAAELKAGTTTTSEMTEDVWKNFFMSISRPVELIAKMLSHMFGTETGGEMSELLKGTVRSDLYQDSRAFSNQVLEQKQRSYNKLRSGGKSTPQAIEAARKDLEDYRLRQATAFTTGDDVLADRPVQTADANTAAVFLNGTFKDMQDKHTAQDAQVAIQKAAQEAEATKKKLGQAAPSTNTAADTTSSAAGVVNFFGNTHNYNTVDWAFVAPLQASSRPVNQSGQQTPIRPKLVDKVGR